MRPLPWDPDPTELLPAERELLARLGPVGLDGLTPRSALAARHGVGAYHGWRDAIALPATSALGLPLAFHVWAEPEVSDLVPEHAWADHVPSPDARANFAEALAGLVSVLGPARRNDVSNTLGARWAAGAFRIELLAFPPELQGAWAAKNTLHAKAPHLVHRATVSFGAPGAFAVPDGSLRSVVAGPRVRVGDASDAGWGPRRWPRRFARRNPALLAAAVGDGCVAWREAGRAGLSERTVSLVFPADPAARVVVTHGTEERSSASRSDVDWVCGPERVELFSTGDPGAATEVAHRLAGAWDLVVTGLAPD